MSQVNIHTAMIIAYAKTNALANVNLLIGGSTQESLTHYAGLSTVQLLK